MQITTHDRALIVNALTEKAEAPPVIAAMHDSRRHSKRKPSVPANLLMPSKQASPCASPAEAAASGARHDVAPLSEAPGF